METRRRAHTRGHPPAGTGASLVPSLPGPGPPRSPPGRAASHGAAPPHRGWRRPRSGWGRGRGERRALAGAAGASRGPGAASRNAEVSPGGGLFTPSQAAAAWSGAGRRCAGVRTPSAGRGAAASSLACLPAGRRGQAVPGRLRARCPRRRAALHWPRARLPCPVGPRCPVPSRRQPAALARPLRCARVTHAYTRTGDTARWRAAHARGRRRRWGPRPANRARARALSRMPGARSAAPLSRELAPFPPPPLPASSREALARRRFSRSLRRARPAGGGKGRFRARGSGVSSGPAERSSALVTAAAPSAGAPHALPAPTRSAGRSRSGGAARMGRGAVNEAPRAAGGVSPLRDRGSRGAPPRSTGRRGGPRDRRPRVSFTAAGVWARQPCRRVVLRESSI